VVDLEYLQRAQDQGLLVPFVGAGLGAAAGLPDWRGLLDHGLDYAVSEGRVDAADARLDEARRVAGSGMEDALLDAFELMRGLLDADPKRAPGFEAFLAEVFADPDPGPGAEALLRALHFIEPRRVITTNYDTLLEDFGLCGGLEKSTTWQRPAEFRDVFRLGRAWFTCTDDGTWRRASSSPGAATTGSDPTSRRSRSRRRSSTPGFCCSWGRASTAHTTRICVSCWRSSRGLLATAVPSVRRTSCSSEAGSAGKTGQG